MTEQNQQSLLLGKIAAYTEILVKDPSSTIFVSLAETYRKMGMYDDARQIISRGMLLHADFSPAYIVLARILCQLEDFAGSVAAFDRALELDSDNLAALVGYSRVQILLGNEAFARELLLKARNLSPADPIINKLLLSLPEVFDLEEPLVEESSEVADEVVPEAVELVSPTLAELYLAQGLTEKSLNIYQQLSDRNPDDLTFRRKVKELEVLLTDNKTEVSDEFIAVVDDQHEYQEQEDANTFIFEPDVALENGLVLDTLNRWLNNIKLRRDNV